MNKLSEGNMAMNTTIQPCPGCTRQLYFAHEASNIIQCTCGSVILRKDNELLSKPFPIIQQPNDPIQPGTMGVYLGRPFKVLGRFRAWIEEFVFNYWTIIFQDNQISYLAEGYGLYAIYEPITVERKLTSNLLEDVKVGAQRDLYKTDSFLLERKYTCYKWEIEGELYIPFAQETFRTYEFATIDDRRIEVMDFAKDRIFTYNVTYTSYTALQLSNTRTYTQSVKPITCSKCHQANEIKSYPYAQSYACIHCEARYSLKDGYSFTIERKQNNTGDGTNITIGSKGVIKKVAYEVIGYLLKEENNIYRSRWKEYTLYNPQEGFAFLSEYSGHWIFVKEKGDAPVLEKEHVDSFTYAEEPFQLFNKYSFEVINSVGEFPYNVFNDDDKNVKEFISPPEIWIQEKSTREGIIWYYGEHMDRNELQKAFREGIVLPEKNGVGAVEPKGFVNPYKIASVAFMAALIFIFAHLATSMGAQDRIILSNEFSIPDSLSTATFVSDKFTLNKWKSNMQFNIYAPVDNSWFELSATLVNTKTGTEYALQQGVEYYHGYSEGEYWKEGDRYETAYLSSIPAGTYYLQLQGTREQRYVYSNEPGMNSYRVQVTYDSPNHRNLIYCLIALLLWPLVQYQVVQYNEKSRWSNSPFSPYNSTNND